MTKEKIETCLKQVEHLHLGTVDENGQPIVHTVAYVSKGSDAYFWTDSRTRKAANIKSNGKVAYALNGPFENWNEVKGIQMIGQAEIITDEKEIQEILNLTLEKFPQMKSMPDDFDMRLFKISPVSAIYLDNTVRYAYTEKADY